MYFNVVNMIAQCHIKVAKVKIPGILYINTMKDSTFAFNVTRNHLQGHEVTAEQLPAARTPRTPLAELPPWGGCTTPPSKQLTATTEHRAETEPREDGTEPEPGGECCDPFVTDRSRSAAGPGPCAASAGEGNALLLWARSVGWSSGASEEAPGHPPPTLRPFLKVGHTPPRAWRTAEQQPRPSTRNSCPADRETQAPWVQ